MPPNVTRLPRFLSYCLHTHTSLTVTVGVRFEFLMSALTSCKSLSIDYWLMLWNQISVTSHSVLCSILDYMCHCEQYSWFSCLHNADSEWQETHNSLCHLYIHTHEGSEAAYAQISNEPLQRGGASRVWHLQNRLCSTETSFCTIRVEQKNRKQHQHFVI